MERKQQQGKNPSNIRIKCESQIKWQELQRKNTHELCSAALDTNDIRVEKGKIQ